MADNVSTCDTEPSIANHTRQTSKALALLFFYSALMFTLPFASFFGTRYILKDTFNIIGYNNTVWSVAAAVMTVYAIIMSFAYHAFYDTEYDDQGNPITTNKSKQD